MTTRPPLDDIRRAAFRALHQDGLDEVAAGVFLFIIALATGRPAFAWTWLVGIVVLGPGLTRVRLRYTWPRIGYAALPDEERSTMQRGFLAWVLGALALVALGLGLSGGLLDHLAWRQAAPALAGLLFAGGLVYMGQRSGLKRDYGLAVAAVLSGGLMATQVVDGAYGNLRVWALLMSLSCLAVGGLAFRHFLRTHPIAADWEPDVP